MTDLIMFCAGCGEERRIPTHSALTPCACGSTSLFCGASLQPTEWREEIRNGQLVRVITDAKILSAGPIAHPLSTSSASRL